MPIAQSLQSYLQKQGVRYELVPHRHTFSSIETAKSAHVPGDRLAKSVVMHDAQGYVVAVVPSTHHVDVSTVQSALHRSLALANENEIASVFRDCELGAVPPVGAAYGVETVLDDCCLEAEGDVYFEAGDHEDLVHVSADSFRKLMAEARHAHISHHV